MTGRVSLAQCGVCCGASHVSLNTSIVNDLVDVVGSNTRHGGASGNVQDLACQSADLAHTFLLGLVENGDLVLADKDLLGARDTIFGVVGARDVFGDLALGR
jgi:hypothetical protein